MWRVADAGPAIDALAAAGHVVLGVDVRDYSADGSFVETAWSAFEPHSDEADVENGRRAARSALRRPDLPGNWALVSSGGSRPGTPGVRPR